jgi:hypothetical protein
MYVSIWWRTEGHGSLVSTGEVRTVRILDINKK